MMNVDAESGIWTSWNGNKRHAFSTLTEPRSEEELIRAVSRSAGFRPFGNGQSSADICAGTSALADMRGYRRIVSVDEEKREITVEAGMTLAELMRSIEERGWALPALPDIDSVTVGGALATGTHGTCGTLLSGYCTRLRIIGADGAATDYSRGDEIFEAVRCSLGVLGIISTATFACVPLRTLQISEAPVRDDEWLEAWPEWLERHDFLRILWLPHTGYGYVMRGDYREEPDENFSPAEPFHHRYRRDVSRLLYKRTVRHPGFTPLANRILKALFFSSTIRRFGSLYGATVTKSRNATLELAEWSSGREEFPRLFRELKRELDRRDNGAWAHIPMDVRFLDQDETWLSYASGRPAVTVGCVTRHPETADEYRAFDVVEKSFLAWGGRPHWAKHYRARAEELSRLWPRFEEFVRLRSALDPDGLFLNEYLRRLFGVV